MPEDFVLEEINRHKVPMSKSSVMTVGRSLSQVKQAASKSIRGRVACCLVASGEEEQAEGIRTRLGHSEGAAHHEQF